MPRGWARAPCPWAFCLQEVETNCPAQLRTCLGLLTTSKTQPLKLPLDLDPQVPGPGERLLGVESGEERARATHLHIALQNQEQLLLEGADGHHQGLLQFRKSPREPGQKTGPGKRPGQATKLAKGGAGWGTKPTIQPCRLVPHQLHSFT